MVCWYLMDRPLRAAKRDEYLESLLIVLSLPFLLKELEASGLKEAFMPLHNERGVPGKKMSEFRKKGNESITLGRKDVVKNI